MPEKPVEYTDKRSAINTNNEVIEVFFKNCPHCKGDVPIVGPCPDCHNSYDHVTTVENPETGFIHFVYECKCEPPRNKAQKIIKIYDGNSNSNRRDDLIKNFL